MTDNENYPPITLLKAFHMAEELYDTIAFGTTDNAPPEARGVESEQLLMMAMDQLSVARHTLKLASIKEIK